MKLKDFFKNRTFFIIIISTCVLSIALGTVSLTLSIKNLTNQISTENNIKATEKELEEKNKQIKEYKTLIRNFNSILLNTVYYGYAEAENGGAGHSFTAFSLFFNGKFYLITAGHSVEYNSMKYKNFKFKPNNKDIWIYPKLINYKNDYNNNMDFAVFYDDNILKGLYPDDKNLDPAYVIGNTERNISILKEYKDDYIAKEGESGSPLLNGECKVIGVLIKNKGEFTPIALVLNEINKIIVTQK